MERVGNWLVSGEGKDVGQYFIEGKALIFCIVNKKKSQSKILSKKKNMMIGRCEEEGNKLEQVYKARLDSHTWKKRQDR